MGHRVGDRRVWVSGVGQAHLCQLGEPGPMVELIVGALGDPRHGGHDVDRIVTDGSLAGKHQDAGPIPDGVGYVGRFGSGRLRCLDHRLQHLRGSDCWTAQRDALANDLLLEDG